MAFKILKFSDMLDNRELPTIHDVHYVLCALQRSERSSGLQSNAYARRHYNGYWGVSVRHLPVCSLIKIMIFIRAEGVEQDEEHIGQIELHWSCLLIF